MYVCIHVCTCVHACAPHSGVCLTMSKHVEARGGFGLSFIVLPLVSETGYLTDPGAHCFLARLINRQPWQSCLCSYQTSVSGTSETMPDFLLGSWGFELRFFRILTSTLTESSLVPSLPCIFTISKIPQKRKTAAT